MRGPKGLLLKGAKDPTDSELEKYQSLIVTRSLMVLESLAARRQKPEIDDQTQTLVRKKSCSSERSGPLSKFLRALSPNGNSQQLLQFGRYRLLNSE